MSDKLQLLMGTSDGLEEVIVESGKVLFTTDEHKLYINGPTDTSHIALNAAHADTATLATTADTWTTGRTLTIGKTGKSVNGSANISWSLAEIGATVSNTWTAGTTSGPTIKTTVNGVTGTAVAIPSASASASGIVTTGNQTFAGIKTFNSTIQGSVSGSAATWATSRNFTISGTATGASVSVNGSSNVELKLPKTISGLTSVTSTSFIGDLTGDVIGNADTATKLASAFTLSLTGSVTGSASIDGSGNISLNTSTNHTHSYAGSSSAGGAANSVKGTLTMKINGTTKTSYNGSSGKEFDVTLADLGLTKAMQFIGTSTTGLSDGATTSPITLSDNSSVTPAAGDVVLYSGKEFIWTGSAWELLGDEGSYALNSVSITGTGALSGGGTLAANRQITHNTTGSTGKSNSSQTKSITGSGGSGTFTIPVISVDTYGHTKYTGDSTITLTYPTLPTLYNLTIKTVTDAASSATYSSTFDPDSAGKTFKIYKMKGATTSEAGYQGLVPAPTAGTTYRALLANGTWGEPGIEWGSF